MGQSLFWARFRPKSPSLDISRLLGPHLRKGRRFETKDDVAGYRDRAIELLSHPRHGSTALAGTLRDCRDGHYRCGQSYCATCMRWMRLWRCAEYLRLMLAARGEVFFLTLNLEVVAFAELDGQRHHVRRYATRLYQQLRTAMPDAVVLGGWEAARKRGTDRAHIHIHLLVWNVSERAIRAFHKRFYPGKRRYKLVKARKRPKLVSYVQKFTTYQRPWKQAGRRKPPAVPLPPRLHTPLVKWMAAHKPTEFLFLFNVRRQGMVLVPNERVKDAFREPD